MKKRTIVLFAAAFLSVGAVAGATATNVIRDIKAQLRPDFTVEIDGVKREFKNAGGDTVYPVLYEGTTYLPVRAIGEIMGKTVYWYEDEKRIELKDVTVTDADVIVAGSENNVNPNETIPTPSPLPTMPAPDAKPEALDADFISKEKAQEIALQKAGVSASDVIFDRTELDEDDGLWHYEVEFRHGTTEYDADIKASDGTILEWDVDTDD